MTLSELIERVEKLDGPDRETDCEIAWLTDWNITGRHGGQWRDAFPQWRGDESRTNQAANNWGVPMFTASLDAAIALTERVLSGQEWSVGYPDTLGSAWGKVRTGPLQSIQDSAPSPAIALILATLRALSAQERDDGR